MTLSRSVSFPVPPVWGVVVIGGSELELPPTAKPLSPLELFAAESCSFPVSWVEPPPPCWLWAAVVVVAGISPAPSSSILSLSPPSNFSSVGSVAVVPLAMCRSSTLSPLPGSSSMSSSSSWAVVCSPVVGLCRMFWGESAPFLSLFSTARPCDADEAVDFFFGILRVPVPFFFCCVSSRTFALRVRHVFFVRPARVWDPCPWPSWTSAPDPVLWWLRPPSPLLFLPLIKKIIKKKCFLNIGRVFFFKSYASKNS